MKKQSKLVSPLKVAFLIIFLSGCNARSTVDQAATSTAGPATTLSNTASPTRTPIPTPTTDFPFTPTSPPISAGSGTITLISNRDGNVEIYLMNADGSGLANLTNNSNNDFSPVWSPDGTKIAFQSYRDSQEAEIYVMTAVGGGAMSQEQWAAMNPMRVRTRSIVSMLRWMIFSVANISSRYPPLHVRPNPLCPCEEGFSPTTPALAPGVSEQSLYL